MWDLLLPPAMAERDSRPGMSGACSFTESTGDLLLGGALGTLGPDEPPESPPWASLWPLLPGRP